MSSTPRAWQRMLSGRRLDLLSPRAENIDIGDIAHGLARVARWNGQTKGEHAFSVAQHSLIVTEIVEGTTPDLSSRDYLAALLHDAPEYVIGDLISPFKAAIGLDYKAFEERLLAAIYERFGVGAISSAVAQSIKAADKISAYYEATLLAGFTTEEAATFFGSPNLPVSLRDRLGALAPISTADAEARFLAKFTKLRER